MLKVLDRLNPDVDTLIICTDVPLLRYFVQEKLEKLYNVDKNYSIPIETGVLYKKTKNDALVAPFLGDRWLLNVNVDKTGVDNVLSLLNWGNGNSITLIYTEKYINYKKLINSEKYKNIKPTVLTLYLSRLDMDDIIYLYRQICNNTITDDILNFLCKNYRYDVARVMELFSKLKAGLKIGSKQDVIDEIGLGGVTPASFTIDLLRVFQNTGRYKNEISITEKKLNNAQKKYLGIMKDLSKKYDYRTIYNQMRSTLKGICDIKALLLNGKYQRITKVIPEGYSQEQLRRIQALQRFDYAIREEISLKRVLAMLELFEKTPETFDYEIILINIICSFISLWEVELNDCQD